MEQIENNGAAPYLPEEIITNILSRLPAKSVIRFQCICKYWKNLLKTPSFIADHLRHNHQNPSVIFSESYVSNTPRLRFIDCAMQVRYVPKVPPPFDSLKFNVIGSSNGLLCGIIRNFPRSTPSFIVWNPLTRDVREVPESRSRNVHPCVLGFGFSPIVNDYKIVAVYREVDGRICGSDVYSLSRNSWKEIEIGNLDDVTCSDSTVSVNGVIFSYGVKSKKYVIVSFDTTAQVFDLIPLPPLSGSDPIFQLFDLTVYEDKFAILTTSEMGRSSSKVDLWVLDEDISSPGKRWSWNKKFTSGVYPWTFSCGVMLRNEIVLSGTENRGKEEGENRGCLLNVTSSKFKMLDLPRHVPCFFNYVESLVPVVNFHNIEETS
ncbi:hypothetical protein K1719_016917 [Acacia pycnantha]|nr:hypothetical protein K1719_016917 [Acacia pycnantha]